MLTPEKPLPAEVADWKIIFCGASVGYAWRLHLVYPNVRTLTDYRFDKTNIVEEALDAHPDAVIVKECAAYFPDGDTDIEVYAGWMRQLREGGTRPIAATVVPVTRAHAQAHAGRAEGLWAFNDELRALCQAEGYALLDLERALRVSANDRHLRPEIADRDGLHLPRRSYRECLDHLVPVALLDARQRYDG